MRTEVLRNFVVLADEKSMTVAAKRLHISQPALSRQMAALEEDLGRQLYTREDGAIKLTQEGRILYEHALSITELETRAREAIIHSDEQVSGTVYIGYGDASAMGLVFQAMSDVRDAYPNVVFNLVSGDTSLLIDMLGTGAIDFMLECGMRTRGRYQSLSLPGGETIAAVVGRSSRLYGKERVTPQDLLGENLVISRQFFESAVMREWAGATHQLLKVAVFFNLGMSMFQLAEFGTGCVIAYKELAENFYGGDIRCIPLDPPLHDSCGIVWRKNRTLSPTALAFIEAMERVIGGAPER